MRPRGVAASFGLLAPKGGAELDGWLRLKGVRDIVSGLVVFAVMIRGGASLLGLLILVEALIPTGDMLTILAARGSTGRALGVHGATALLMLAVGASLLLGLA
jgi:hypothetical protein